MPLASCAISGALACVASYLRDRNERRLFVQELARDQPRPPSRASSGPAEQGGMASLLATLAGDERPLSAAGVSLRSRSASPSRSEDGARRLSSARRSVRTALEATQAAAAAIALAETGAGGPHADAAEILPRASEGGRSTSTDSVRRVGFLEREAPRSPPRRSRVHIAPLVLPDRDECPRPPSAAPSDEGPAPPTPSLLQLPTAPEDSPRPAGLVPMPRPWPGRAAHGLRLAGRWLLRGSPLEPPELEARFQEFYAELAWARVRLLSVPLTLVYVASCVTWNLLGTADARAFVSAVDWIVDLGVVGSILVVATITLYVRPPRLVPHWSKLLVAAFAVAQVARMTTMRRLLETLAPRVTEEVGLDRLLDHSLPFWNLLSGSTNLAFLSPTFWLPARASLAVSGVLVGYAAFVLLGSGGLELLLHLVNFILIPCVVAAIACARGEVNLRRRFCIENGSLAAQLQ